MVRHRLLLLPMSDYSARDRDDDGFHNQDGVYFRTLNGMDAQKGGGRRSSNRGQARRTGETLLLELLPAPSRDDRVGEGLLPSLNTARGITSLHEMSSQADNDPTDKIPNMLG